MRVADLMQTEVQTVPPDAVVTDAVLALAEYRVSALPVVDRQGHLVGVFSRTDILASEEEAENQSARATLFNSTRVRDLMTVLPLTIAPGAEIRDAARQMLDASVHRLFVQQGERLVGVISTTDIMRAVAEERLR